MWQNFLGGIFFGGFFGRIFLGGFFWEDFFGRIFWEDFWEDCFWRNSLFYFNVEGIDLFVKILDLSRFCLKARRKEGRILDP